ncbi:MAG: hypothetical protein SGARI_005727, partial [Bacillariaceae sp.]
MAASLGYADAAATPATNSLFRTASAAMGMPDITTTTATTLQYSPVLIEDRKPSAAAAEDMDTKPSAAAVEENETALIAREAAKIQCRDEIEVQKEMDQMFESYSKTKYEGLPPYKQAPGFKDDVVLHEHQKDGVRWLIHQEENYDQRVSPFFKVRKTTTGKEQHRQENTWYVHDFTGKYQKSKPVPDVGAILADDMGLGKSIQTLALMLSCMPKKDHEPRATLLVAPVSVIASWQFQISKFIEKDHLNIEVYLGGKRQPILNRIKRKDDIDVVFTSYETLASDWTNYQDAILEKKETALAKKKKCSKKTYRDFVRDAWDGGDDDDDDWAESSESEEDEDDHYLPASMTRKRKAPANRPSTWIFELEFHRVVLDEAHKIRNSKTKFFKSCCAILANRRLAITGTPFVNKTEDIHSLLSFLNANNANVSNPLLPKDKFAKY